MENTKKENYAFERLPIDKERRVNDRELLTFTNLTNLRWEFLDVFDKNNEDILNKAVSTSLLLSDILEAPERFVRGYRDPVKKKDPIYVYGNDISGNYLGKEEGEKELKEAAGIAMEYLEKDEGKFLEEWEVVYGADNYKLTV